MRAAFSLLALLGVLLALVSSQGSTQLVYVQELFRHGARHPIYINKGDNSSYARHQLLEGELTKQGKSMHYVLGNYLYKEYWERLFGVGVREYNQSKFYVKSTNVNRTIESAQSQLLGLFENLTPLEITDNEVQYSMPTWAGIPPRKAGNVFTNSPQFQPIPIHVEKPSITPWDRGDFLRFYSADVCYKQKDWTRQNELRTKWLSYRNHPKVQAAHQALNQAVGHEVYFWDIYKYIDSATTQRYSGRKYLQVFNPNGEHFHTFNFIWTLDLFAKLYHTEQQLAATATGFFNRTSVDFRRIEQDASGIQWVFYSAHDTTIGNFLARLNLTNAECIFDNFQQGRYYNNESNTCILEYPNYASTLIFEVHKYQNGTHVMRIRYNGLYRTIPFCGYQNECTLEQYYQWYNSWKNQDYKDSCGIVDSYKEDASVYFALMVIFIALVLCLGIYYIVKRLERKQKESVVPAGADHKKEDDESGKFKQSLLSQDEIEREA